MSLYGALYSGVSGLKAQSNRIGVISDNIANVNTIGYKGGVGLFQSLVTGAGGGGAFSPGGVLGRAQQLVSQQGLLQTTNSQTDIAISGSGFFVVNTSASGTGGQVLYTRAGSFTQDSTGNFINSAGFFLQAWPLDRDGRLPGEPGNVNTTASANLASLRTVNVQNLTGAAAATTAIGLGANLRAGQTTFPGSSVTGGMNPNYAQNSTVRAQDIILPGGVNNLTRGDKFSVTGTTEYTYQYGGFTFSRNVGSVSLGDSGTSLLTDQVTLSVSPAALHATTAVEIFNGDNTVVITSATAHGLTDGDVVTLAGLTDVGNILAGELNDTYTITYISDTQFSIEVATTANTDATGGGGAGTFDAEVFAVTDGSQTVRVRSVGHGLADGAVVTLSGVSGSVAGIPATDFNNNKFVINYVDEDHYEITVATAADNTAVGGGGGTIVSDRRSFVGNMLDATSATAPFLGSTGISNFTSAALSFTINTASTGTVTFTYVAGTPNATAGQFNTLNNLATAINNVNGLSARVSNDGRLYVSGTDANEAITFANGSTVGSDGPPVLEGIDWVRELGFANLEAGENRYSTLQGLAGLVNNSAGLSATILNPLTDSSIRINTDDPLGTINFDDWPVPVDVDFDSGDHIETTIGSNVVTIFQANHGLQDGDVIQLDLSGLGSGPFNGIPLSDFSGSFVVTVTDNGSYSITVATAATGDTDVDLTGGTGASMTPHTNSGSPLGALGFISYNGTASQSIGPFGPAYDATASGTNMASGAIAAQFSRPVTVFDAQGSAHDINIAFLKIGVNEWAVEIYALDDSELTTSITGTDGLLAYGTLSFGGDGTLTSISPGLSSDVTINWSNGADPSVIAFDWGDTGTSNGMGQYDTAYRVNFANQNGAQVGDLTGVTIDEAGYITANYSNGQTQRLYKIPIASFPAIDNLVAVSGNAFNQTSLSGEVNLLQAGTSGSGKVSAASLELSNVELADQLTDMIVAQRAYQANTKIISTSDELLQELNQILR